MAATITVIVLILVLSIRNFRLPKLLYVYVARPTISVTVNYTIYYFRRLVLRQSVQQARAEHYEGYRVTSERKHFQATSVNIAVVNKNLNKYTETFIDQKILTLKNAGYYVHRFYGGYFPDSEVNYGHLLSNYELGKSFYAFWEKLWGFPEKYFLKKKFIKYLKQNRVKLVLAEFGTCGVEVYKECQQAGIPLIITFHGYDIHHADVIEANKERYKHMFEYCSKVLCVSRDIMQTISNYYGLSDKLVYLPSTINPDLFKPARRHSLYPTILYVGRFSETKSPHLVILAFNEVLKQVPEARLVMVGRGGGGELFEACLMLAKALSLDDKIDFKGVLTPEQVYQEMQQASVFIQYSVTTPVTGDKEGTPVSVQEAMAVGLPVVATKHAGIEEIMENEVTGLLVAEYDQKAVVSALLRLLQNTELAQRIANNAIKFMSTNNAISKNTNTLLQIIEETRLK